jgi:hypothetical protein
MGLTASIRVIPAALFNQHKGDLENLTVPVDAKSFGLDKAWVELHAVLRGMGKPLSLAAQGDCPAVGSLDSERLHGPAEDDEEDWDAVDGCYLGYASPTCVTKVNRALGELAENDLLTAIKAAGWPSGKGDQQYYRSASGKLRKAYSTAAAAGAALAILIT